MIGCARDEAGGTKAKNLRFELLGVVRFALRRPFLVAEYVCDHRPPTLSEFREVGLHLDEQKPLIEKRRDYVVRPRPEREDLFPDSIRCRRRRRQRKMRQGPRDGMAKLPSRFEVVVIFICT